eukprot:scaffold79883_cov32-Prasinocladus_malaysianus.AAC.1
MRQRGPPERPRSEPPRRTSPTAREWRCCSSTPGRAWTAACVRRCPPSGRMQAGRRPGPAKSASASQLVVVVGPSGS